MNNIGNEIKRIRLERNIRAKEVYEGILSRTMYYRFENKNESISYPLLFQICERLNIDYKTLEIFFSIDNYQKIIEYIYFLFFNERNQLNDYSQQLQIKFEQTGCMKYRHLSIISHNLYLKYYFNTLDNNEVYEFKSYIFGVDCWYEYEIYLIINGIFLFSLDEIDGIYHRLIKRIRKLNLPDNQFVILTTGIISICYSQQDYSRFRRYIRRLISHSDFSKVNISSMFSRTIIKFYYFLDEYIRNPSHGIEKNILQILDFFLLVDMPQMFNIHHSLFNFIKVDEGV